MKYLTNIALLQRHTNIIEAETTEEAREKAIRLAKDGKHPSEIDDTHVYEIRVINDNNQPVLMTP